MAGQLIFYGSTRRAWDARGWIDMREDEQCGQAGWVEFCGGGDGFRILGLQLKFVEVKEEEEEEDIIRLSIRFFFQEFLGVDEMCGGVRRVVKVVDEDRFLLQG